jgi:hypothetical protein
VITSRATKFARRAAEARCVPRIVELVRCVRGIDVALANSQSGGALEVVIIEHSSRRRSCEASIINCVRLRSVEAGRAPVVNSLPSARIFFSQKQLYEDYADRGDAIRCQQQLCAEYADRSIAV